MLEIAKERVSLNTSRAYRDIIRETMKSGDYEEAYKLSLLWKENIINKNIETERFFIWACYYYLGVTLWGLGQFHEAISYLEESLVYAVGVDLINSMTTMALCQKGLNKEELALEMYQDCLEECLKQMNGSNDQEYLRTVASIYHNIGEILNEESYFYESINTYKKIIPIDDTMQIVIIGKIDNNYKTLFELYIKKQNYLLARKMISKITDVKKKAELRNRIPKGIL